MGAMIVPRERVPASRVGEDREVAPGRRARTILIILFVVGFALRALPILWGSAWYDRSQYSMHSDEPKLIRYIDDFPDSFAVNQDYRYPTFLHNTYGVLWSVVREVTGHVDPAPAWPGTRSYEAALIFGRALTLLVFGLGGMWLVWRFTERAFGPGPALWALAAFNLMAWSIGSTALIQTDVPSTVGLLLVFYLLLGVERSSASSLRSATGIGAALGAAVAMKYPAAIGLVAIVIVAVHSWRRGAASPARCALFLGVSIVAGALTFIVFVPGAVTDYELFELALRYESTKATDSYVPLLRVWRSLVYNLPPWVLATTAIGLVVWIRRPKSVTFTAGLICMALYFAIMRPGFKPDYAIMFTPWAAALSGLGLWSLGRTWRADGPRSVARAVLPALAVLVVVAGHGYSGWVVVQRYAGDTRYRFQHWVEENIPPGPIGYGPYPGLQFDWSAPREPIGWEFVSVYEKPKWIVLAERHYQALVRFMDDPTLFPQHSSSVPGARRLLGLTEQDFQFYEDLLLGERRDFRYELVEELLPLDVPLDKTGKPVLFYRRLDVEPMPLEPRLPSALMDR